MRTGRKLMAVKTTQKIAITMPMLKLSFQNWMISPDAVRERAYVMAPVSYVNSVPGKSPRKTYN